MNKKKMNTEELKRAIMEIINESSKKNAILLNLKWLLLEQSEEAYYQSDLDDEANDWAEYEHDSIEAYVESLKLEDDYYDEYDEDEYSYKPPCIHTIRKCISDCMFTVIYKEGDKLLHKEFEYFDEANEFLETQIEQKNQSGLDN